MAVIAFNHQIINNWHLYFICCIVNGFKRFFLCTRRRDGGYSYAAWRHFSSAILDWFDCPMMFSLFPNDIPVLLLCVSFCLLWETYLDQWNVLTVNKFKFNFPFGSYSHNALVGALSATHNAFHTAANIKMSACEYDAKWCSNCERGEIPFWTIATYVH